MITTKFKHTLPTQQIVVRQDAGNDSDVLPNNIGQMYPLVRIKEKTLEFADIVAFNFSVGQSFLPTVTVSIDDAEQKFKESNFIEKHDIITIYVGNAKDKEHEVIKNDYYVIDVITAPGSYISTIEAVLHVPKLYESFSRHFDNTSIGVIETIAKEVGLGFASNSDSSLDQMSWIQHQTNYDFLHWVISRSHVGTDSMLRMYVDQYANLTVVDIKKALDSSAETLLTTAPITGDALEVPVKLVATNNAEGDVETRARIITWSPITNYGMLAKWFSSTTKSLLVDSTTDAETEIVSNEITKQLKASSTWTHFSTDNAFDGYAAAKVYNVINSQLLQGIQMSITLDYYIPAIHTFMTLPVEIWNTAKRTERLSQDTNVDNEQLETIEPVAPTNTYEINKRLTGDTLITSMSFSYNRKPIDSDESRKMTQSIQVFMKRQSADTAN